MRHRSSHIKRLETGIEAMLLPLRARDQSAREPRLGGEFGARSPRAGDGLLWLADSHLEVVGRQRAHFGVHPVLEAGEAAAAADQSDVPVEVRPRLRRTRGDSVHDRLRDAHLLDTDVRRMEEQLRDREALVGEANQLLAVCTRAPTRRGGRSFNGLHVAGAGGW